MICSVCEPFALWRDCSRLKISTSWPLTDANEIDGFIRDRQLDLVILARPLLANPYWPYAAARALGIDQPASVLPTPCAYSLQSWSGA